MRIRALGRSPGILPPGSLNLLTDVSGVAVGHVTKTATAAQRTGVTVILPHQGNVFAERVPAGICVLNGHGKMTGLAQVAELGEIETPIALVNTLSVGRATEALVDYTLEADGNERVTSVNAVVGETNDSPLNDIRARGISSADVREALRTASTGVFDLGAVGAGTGTMTFGWKGGIGSSSRVVEIEGRTHVVGALVQSNFEGVANIDGLPLGKHSGQHIASRRAWTMPGSIMMVLATDAPISDRNCRRLAFRAGVGLARTGASFDNGSGDFALAFSTSQSVRRHRGKAVHQVEELANDSLSPLFLAAIEATEEAIYDSLLVAEGVEGVGSAPRSATAHSILPSLRALLGDPT